jgi:hypothetical protein
MSMVDDGSRARRTAKGRRLTDRARLCHAFADAYAKATCDAAKAAQQMKSTLHRINPATVSANGR